MLSGNIEKITQLSLDLLNYAKTAQISRRLCDPNQPAIEVKELMGPRAQRLGIDFRTDLSDQLSSFYFDPEAVYRVLLNLVVNAVDAFASDTAEPPPCKEIVLSSAPGNNGGVEYRVTDNGCGMSKDIRSRIFQDFFTTKGTRGTGIGLMMTKNIVEKHGGDITVRSRAGEGSSFRVQLPGRQHP
jgi:signal transduction histidine kinase